MNSSLKKSIQRRNTPSVAGARGARRRVAPVFVCSDLLEATSPSWPSPLALWPVQMDLNLQDPLDSALVSQYGLGQTLAQMGPLHSSTDCTLTGLQD